MSLFVAAIGIANTMMMSIYERTKEIGVIKVLGCSLRNIKQMFLLEAAFYRIYRRTGRKYLKFFDLFCDQCDRGQQRGNGSGRKYFLYSALAGSGIHDFCSICGDGGRLFPGTSGNAAEPIGSNP